MVRLYASIAAALLAVILVFGAYFIKRAGLSLSKFTKPAALLLAGVMFVRYMWDQPAVYYVRGLNMYSPFGDDIFSTVVSVLLIWFSFAAMLTIVMNEFFKYDTLRRIVNCFSLPVFLLTFVFFDTLAIGSFGAEDYTLASPRLWMMVFEIGVAIALPISHVVAGESVALPKSLKDAANMLYAIPFALLAIMPCYVPQALFGFIDPSIKLYDFTEEHRFMIYFAFVIPFIIYHALKNKPQDVKRFIMIYLTIAMFWAYIGRWNLAELASPLNWPLHLCNTAMFIIPICLVFKMNRLFNFCLFVNIIGAFLAMILPGELDSLNAFGTERVSFWLNHYGAFCIPILLIALKLFPRPKFKEWVYSIIEFAVYFFSILFINAWFSNYEETDFFFLNSDFIVSSLGTWAERTRDFVVSFNIGELSFTFYPVYQTLFFIIYIAFTVALWFIYELLFKSWDAAEDRRLRERDYKRMKKELKEYLGEKASEEAAGGAIVPCLKLNHFSKRYGSNKHYSVNDASLEVRGGEIFGFLGPNGAGKSTIIKSVVGIQTITSGDIEICGYNIEKQPVEAKLHTGFVPDHYALYENLTGREYINYIADLYRVDRETRDERIEKYVERFQLTGSFDNQMKTYSHGMKQKIAIMAALVHNPEVWILDEPLTGLDPTSIHEVKECMKEHAANGNIVFFSSHIIDVVEKICDRIAIIKKGKLRATTTIKALEDSGIELEDFYLSIINDGDDEHVPFIEESAAPEEVAKA